MPKQVSSKSQQGQVLVLLALAIVVLAAMLGLVIDGGMAQSQKQVSQSAADGAALAAGYTIEANPSAPSTSTATTAATSVITRDGLAGGSLTMTYYTSSNSSGCSGSTTTTPSAVQCVQASVSLTTNTYFLRVLRFNSFSLASTAQAIIPAQVAIPCAFCFLNSSTAIHWSHNNNKTVTVSGGPIYNDSGSSNAFQFDGDNTTISAPAGIFVHASSSPPGCYQGSSNTFTPDPTCNMPVIADPLAATPLPANPGGAHKNYNGSPSTTTLSPGIYDYINVSAGNNVTLSAGTYILTGNGTITTSGHGQNQTTTYSGIINLTGGTLNASSGVTIYLACSNYPTACNSNGENGAIINQAGGTLTLSAPSVAPYKSLSVFADRKNNSTNTLGQSANETINGTIYTLKMPLNTTSNSNVTVNGALLVDTFNNTNPNYNFTLNVNYTTSNSYTPPGGFGPLVRLTLSQ